MLRCNACMSIVDFFFFLSLFSHSLRFLCCFWELISLHLADDSMADNIGIIIMNVHWLVCTFAMYELQLPAIDRFSFRYRFFNLLKSYGWSWKCIHSFNLSHSKDQKTYITTHTHSHALKFCHFSYRYMIFPIESLTPAISGPFVQFFTLVKTLFCCCSFWMSEIRNKSIFLLFLYSLCGAMCNHKWKSSKPNEMKWNVWSTIAWCTTFDRKNKERSVKDCVALDGSVTRPFWVGVQNSPLMWTHSPTKTWCSTGFPFKKFKC